MASEVKLNLDQVLLNNFGISFKRKEKEQEIEVTLGHAICDHVGSAQNVDGDVSIKLYRILKRMQGGGNQMFDIIDLDELIKILKTIQTNVIVKGQILAMLEDARQNGKAK
ncbi:MAG: hypothetical protein Q8Q69_05755 [Nitrosopumilaceae archaeon]|nr:hypothetical protein [Nitrosopumilaceae archaeon]